MAEPIDFYFEFASPYGYLASTQIDAIAERHRRAVAWHPIMLGAAFKETGARPLMQTPLKGPYLLHDMPRFARLLGVPLTLPPIMPMNSLAASRACLWVEQDDPAQAKRLARALFHAHWGEGRDLGSPEAVAEAAVELGIDRDALLEQLPIGRNIAGVGEVVGTFGRGEGVEQLADGVPERLDGAHGGAA
jgi:2-hydroxychromene-2-carboxylate isomerase